MAATILFIQRTGRRPPSRLAAGPHAGGLLALVGTAGLARGHVALQALEGPAAAALAARSE
jgi:hypothetical protein